MPHSKEIEKARAILHSVQGNSLSMDERCSLSIELAACLLNEAVAIQTHKEKAIQAQLARMMDDPNGKAFTTAMTDQCFRTKNPSRVVNQLIFLLNKFGIPRYLSLYKRWAMAALKWVGHWFSSTLVKAIHHFIRRETSRVILPADPKAMSKHMAQRRKEGVRINLNHLGEAILGEREAERRFKIYLDDLAKPDVEYISVKISTISSQLNLLAWEDTLSILSQRLKQLYRAAKQSLYVRPDGQHVPKFVNLDMEEYRDLHLTVDLFCRTLEDPEFFDYPAGIVLQSYLPDSFEIQKQLTIWARERVAKGGAPIKIRIVKGANLAMEQVEASLKGWPQAPYSNKLDVDANFKRMVLFGCQPENASAAHLGIGSHNLFDIAFALILTAENRVEEYVCFEMLEGMADHMRRVVQKLSNEMLLYCPVASDEDFQNAVAYLIRRLDENTAPSNFLRHSFGLLPGTKSWDSQVELFKESCRHVSDVDSTPRRTQNRATESVNGTPRKCCFENEPDSDWSLPHNKLWAEKILEAWRQRKHRNVPLVLGDETIVTDMTKVGEDPSLPGQVLYRYSLADQGHLEKALNNAKKAEKSWGTTAVEERSALLGRVAHLLRKHRETLIGAMIADTGKTIPEADVEVSEAIDFAEYYRRNAEEVHSLEDIKWIPKGTVLVAPPWNFPCSIPAGGILAALAAGNCVIFKPAPESVLVGWHLAQLFWEAGVSRSVLQFLTCDDDPIGSELVKDPRITCMVLTGATATAKYLLKLRPGLDLLAETGGKNAIIISTLSDRDLAVKDLVQSAFGHAGQKCSACSLAICVGEVYDDTQFRNQLKDATASLRVGSQWDSATKMNPLIRAPNPTLLRGLTTLEPGEEWLLQPIQDPDNPNLWSPGIKLGVQSESFTYRNELFGPVLAIMRADNLLHALQLANGTPYGLTSGLHSLDEREHHYWIKHVEAGNCYINRGITGAIVQRQPFGGCKESSFGPGAKAGGPNYVMQLMHPEQIGLPSQILPLEEYPSVIKELTKFVELSGCTLAQQELWHASVGSYLLFWEYYFSKKHDPSMVLGQDNFFYYVPQRTLFLRVQSSDSVLDVLRVMAGAMICGARLEISTECELKLYETPNIQVMVENDEEFVRRVEKDAIRRMRFLSSIKQELQIALANAGCYTLLEPVIANGRVELLRYLQEVSLSVDYHRYGNLGEREGELREKRNTCWSCQECSCYDK